MTLNAEYLAVDGVEVITFRSRNLTAGTEQTASVTSAVRYELTRREVLASDGLYSMQDVVWELPASQLGVLVPEEGDVVQETGGVRWSVLEAQRIAFDTVWRLVCRRER